MNKNINSLFKKFLNQIFFVDFFAITPSKRITFKNKRIFSTKIGVISSWTIILIFFLIFYQNAKDLILHENPQTLASQIVTIDPENFELNPENLFFAFGLQDLRNRSQHYIDESIFYFEIIKRTKIGSNITLEKLESNKCSLYDVPDIDEIKDYYSRNNINNLICIKNYTKIIPELKSTWDGGIYKNILINIKACSNTTYKYGCKSSDIIKNYLNSANFAIYFTNFAVDSNNYEKPITVYGKQIYTPISYSTLTYIEMLFAHTTFSTDKGLIFEDLENHDKVNYVSNRQIISYSPENIVQIDMKLDKITYIYKRKYDKILDILAYIGGIIQIIMIFMSVIVTPLTNFDFKQDLSNYLFEFDNSILNLIPKNKKSVVGNKIASLAKSLKLSSNIFNRENKRIEISFLQYLFSSFQSNVIKLKNKLIDKGLAQVDEIFDIGYIMEKLMEIDKIKLILLNKEQLTLFDCLPKPIITLNESEKSIDNFEYDSIFKIKNNFKKGINAYKIITSKDDKNLIDEVLIKMFNKRKEMKNNFCPSQESNLSKIDSNNQDKNNDKIKNLYRCKLESNSLPFSKASK